MKVSVILTNSTQKTINNSYLSSNNNYEQSNIHILNTREVGRYLLLADSLINSCNNTINLCY